MRQGASNVSKKKFKEIIKLIDGLNKKLENYIDFYDNGFSPQHDFLLSEIELKQIVTDIRKYYISIQSGIIKNIKEAEEEKKREIT
jgi:hypothetical protein